MLEAFRIADNNLKQAICGISDLITVPALINLDFADVKTVIQGQGLAHMGIGRAKGENKIVEAVRQAVSSPMLETTIEGARNLILNITGDAKMSIGAVNEAANLIHGVVDYSANIILGANMVDNLQDEVIITIIATGFADGINNNKARFMSLNQSFEDVAPMQIPQPVIEEQKQEVVEEKEVKEENKEVAEPKKEVPPFVKKLFGRK